MLKFTLLFAGLAGLALARRKGLAQEVLRSLRRLNLHWSDNERGYHDQVFDHLEFELDERYVRSDLWLGQDRPDIFIAHASSDADDSDGDDDVDDASFDETGETVIVEIKHRLAPKSAEWTRAVDQLRRYADCADVVIALLVDTSGTALNKLETRLWSLRDRVLFMNVEVEW